MNSTTSTQDTERPKPGLGILLLDSQNKVLVGKRKDCSLYGIPGGYLEKFESWHDGAAREIKEEVGVTVDPDKLYVVQVYNAMNKGKKYHNVAIVLVGRFPEGQEVKNLEPEKCEGWEWWDLGDFNTRIEEVFYPNRQLIEEYSDKITAEYLNKVLNNPTNKKDCFFVSV